MDTVLIIATLVGGIAGLVYLGEKGRSASWGRKAPDPLPEPEPVSENAQGQLGRLAATVGETLPGFRIVRPRTVTAYAEYVDPVQLLEPWACKGDFFCRGTEDIALFVVNPTSGEYRLVAIREPDNEVSNVLDGIGEPSNMYVQTVEPGTHRVSRSVWKHNDGTKKIRLPCHGIEFGTYESAARVLYWIPDESHFSEQWVSD